MTIWEVEFPLHATQHPLQSGQIFQSFGSHFTYRVVGPCCRLFDRDELPWPCCRLQWRGKEPSWRRIGKRFVVDLSTQNSPSYSVEILGQEHLDEPIVLTLYAVKLPQPVKEWWHSKRMKNEGEEQEVGLVGKGEGRSQQILQP